MGEGFGVIFCLVVNKLVSPQCQYPLCICPITVGNDGQALGLGNRNGHTADTACPARNENGLASLSPHEIQRLHNGQGRQGNGRRLHIGQGVWDFGKGSCLHRHILGKSTNVVKGKTAKDTVTDRKAGHA